MLTQLSLNNIAVFESLTLPVPAGLTMIIGEAGSGKSLLLDAMDWCLGGNVAAKQVIRSGCDQASVELSCEIATPSAALLQWCEQAALDPAEYLNDNGQVTLTLSRSFSQNGTTRCRVNGVVMPRQALEPLREEILALQSQHAAVLLSRASQQRQWVDQYGGAPVFALLAEVKDLFETWQLATQQVAELEAQQASFQAEWDRLTAMDQELAELALTDAEEDVRLRALLERLSHGEQLSQWYQQAHALIVGGETAWGEQPSPLDILDQIRKRLTKAAQQDKSAQSAAETASALLEELRDLAHRVEALHEGLEADPQSLDRYAERIEQLEKAKRRYGPTLADVLATQARIAQQLMSLQTSPEHLALAQQALAQAHHRLSEALAQLTQARQRAARQMEAAMQPLLAQLELPHARLVVDISPQGWGVQGADAIAFLFSANPGEPPRPLGKVASGGELSRILLALKVLLSQQGSGQQVLIFDEIDTGTSGQVARAIAQQLTTLAQAGHQVMVITHQPIVAAAGDCLWQVSKQLVEQDGQARVRSQVQLARTHEQRRALIGWLASGTTDAEAPATLHEFAELLISRGALPQG